jgi:predicted nucleic acid-binding protein
MNLYLDSMQWIYFFEQNPLFLAPTRSMILRSQVARADFLTSHLILAEVLVVPKRNNDLFTATRYRRYFLSSAITLIPFTTDVAERFADIRATTRIKPADALHLALAASAPTDYFVTTDTKLHGLNLPGIGQICPPDDVP